MLQCVLYQGLVRVHSALECGEKHSPGDRVDGCHSEEACEGQAVRP